jgi:Leu/Phe-tRNA-protein transferase
MDMYIKYVNDRYIYLAPEDDCRAIVDFMVAIDYHEEFCVAEDFSAEFVARLMGAGFLVMSFNAAEEGEEPWYVLLPKLHLVRSLLFHEDLHVKRSVRRFLGRYELRPDAEFERIVDRCVEKHGGDWLTPPLVGCIKDIRCGAAAGRVSLGLCPLAPGGGVYPASFGLYLGGELVAGEFGVVCGAVYTSYSGFYDENHAGTAQIILAARYLRERGFAFFDLGMPLEYKAALGASDVNPREFVRLFRAAAG